MKEEIYQQYGIQPREIMYIGEYEGFWIRNKIYVVLPVDGLEEEWLVEIKNISDFMMAEGDTSIADFVPTNQGYYVSELKNRQSILIRCNRRGGRDQEAEGTVLSLFHERGKQYTEEIKYINQIGKWKKMWERRLEQLEKFWQQKVMDRPHDEFDTLFIESFPYYLGLTENAIQYLVDTELDDEPTSFDGATICHRKYSSKYIRSHQHIRVPFDWVYDHPTRDLAEWIRNEWIDSKVNVEDNILIFLKDYEQSIPLSTFAWKLLYSRLLFPLQYFEVIERYYQVKDTYTKNELKQKLERILEDIDEYQMFLRDFYGMIRLPVEQLSIKKVEWL